MRAQDGNEALRFIEGGAIPDLVLLDIMMPRISGFEVCRRIRAIYSPSKLPIIMLTAKDQVNDLVEGFTLGANDYITKPFSKYELFARIRLHLMLANVNIDHITGVSNRFFFDTMYSSEWKRSFRIKNSIAVLLADIDHFTAYTDKYGQQMASSCLKKIARTISQSAKREGDLLARYNENSFAVILPSTDIDHAAQVCQQILDNIRQLAIPGTEEGSIVTVAVGVSSVTPDDTMHPSDLIFRTESALAEAKRRGPGSLCVWGK
ncbi:MAG: diguanylate cyclase domain-containing protein [Spirochaetota bacterium]